MRSILTDYDIVCLSSTEWDVHWGTQQQIIWRLANHNRVLFLEVPISPLSPFTGLRQETWIKQIKRWRQGLRQGEKPNLIIASPPPVVPFRYHKTTNRLTQTILFHYINKVTAGLGFKKPLVLTFQADSGALVRKLAAQARIYYCTDDWSSTGRWWQPAEKVRARERELVETCDLVFCTSQQLTSRLKHFGRPIHFFPNAVDYELFRQAQDLEPAPEIRRLTRPVIGFAGIMHRHSFDDDLIGWLANRHPDWTFAIVGKQEGRDLDLSKLENLSNVRFLGFKPLELLPGYLAGMDVCLIPRRQTDWTQSAFSLKLFEYLAAGKPVVATWTDEYLPYQDLIYLAHSYEEFEERIVRALEENNPELLRNRMRLASENSWDQRVLRFSEIVQNLLNSRDSKS